VDALPPDFTRRDALWILRRFGAVLADGHNFVADVRPHKRRSGAGYIPVAVDILGNNVVVARSSIDAIRPGDTLVAIDGALVGDRLADILARTSAATEWYGRVLASEELLRIEGPTEVTLRAPKGGLRTEVVEAGAFQDTAHLRPSGFLADLDAPQVYYLNLSGEVLDDLDTFLRQLADAALARGLVLDMRGYPGIDHYEVVKRLISGNFHSPLWLVTTRTGTRPPRVVDESMVLVGRTAPPRYDGPVVLLVGPGTVSAAENLSMMLVDAGRVMTVGRTTAGTNGDITGVQLPAGLAFTFTGIEVRFADNRTFHGAGVMPAVRVEPTIADYAAGRDAELEKAISVLRRGP
jgi:C-terminal processing protease CtpA/Prc